MGDVVIPAERLDIVNAITKIKSNYNLTYDELSTLFKVPSDKVKSCNNKSVTSFEDSKEESRFRTEIASVSLLNEISNDSRLKGYINELYVRYHLNNTILAKLTEIEESNIEAFLKVPDAISVEMKYTLCITVIYLLFLFSRRHI